MSPSCARFVPGFGDVNADFHVIGDNPGVHGGVESGVPFTGQPWSDRFFDALADGDLLGGGDPSEDGRRVRGTFFSYLNMCVTEETPSEDDYVTMESFFDSELRAITAHVLLPVGHRATTHVLDTYTADATEVDMDALHGEELKGSGWLVVPIKDPAAWTDGDADRLAAGLRTLQETDYRQISDLGRFVADQNSYLVR